VAPALREVPDVVVRPLPDALLLAELRLVVPVVLLREELLPVELPDLPDLPPSSSIDEVREDPDLLPEPDVLELDLDEEEARLAGLLVDVFFVAIF
jgi:hypothetical protein